MLRVWFLCLAMLPMSLVADDVDFEKQIRPLLRQHCVSCHGPDVQKGGLRLDARALAFRGGDGGPVIRPKDADHSEFIKRITSTDPDLRMPAEADPLDDASIRLLKQWIDDGAVWEETDEDRASSVDTRLSHWAWQPVKDVSPPDIPDATVAIDAFVIQKLNEHGLRMSPEADRRTLIRRLSFDLRGLPPSIDEIAQFLSDQSPKAYEQLVDRMLASPHYGERQARHWLDIAHYADTHGFERDQRRDNAWRYRDWVIRAFNDDMPYDQFLKDQIAGDAYRPDDPQAIIATGFLAAGPWDFVGQAETPSPVLKRLARADDLDDLVAQVMTSTCAVTIHCARCHDHKLDPISQREYYSLTAVFAGVKRADRVVSTKEEQELANRKSSLQKEIDVAKKELAALKGDGIRLADIVGGGDGSGSGKVGHGIDPTTGRVQSDKRGFLEAAAVNVFAKGPGPFIDGVVIPNGADSGMVPVTSTGIMASSIPKTSGKAWDAIRNGPVNSQFSTTLGGVDFANEPHRLLSIHANAAITFDVAALRQHHHVTSLRLESQVGYFGQTPKRGAQVFVLLDGKIAFQTEAIGRDDGLKDVSLELPESARFLTLMATDAGNEISHDQICFVDARLTAPRKELTNEQRQQMTRLTEQVDALQKQLADLPEAARMYGIVSEQPAEMHVMLRGNPEVPGDPVSPGTISCVASAKFSLDGAAAESEAARRKALAEWIASADNPLTRRVIVNRLWQQHIGVGLVDTPSDFGQGGSAPSHPELLDWLANALLKHNWSLKAIHRQICLSATYRQSSVRSEQTRNAMTKDSSNRLLWRQNPRRLDAESVRDAVLTVSGRLNREMFGPGYRDFEYQEEYAPVYTYITADKPDLWRRSIYRFIVRTTPDQFLTTMDCPNAANLTPTRNVTTTALQSLAMWNNEFILKQAQYFAERLKTESDNESPRDTTHQVQRAFQIALGREATPDEAAAAVELVADAGLVEFCRQLLNANEFVYVD